MKEFVSLTMVAMEIGKIEFFSYHSDRSYEENILHQKHEPYRYKLRRLSWID